MEVGYVLRWASVGKMEGIDAIKNQNFFAGQGWGMLRLDPEVVYQACQEMGKSYVVVRDNVQLSDKTYGLLGTYFENVTSMQMTKTMLGKPGEDRLILDSQSVYRYFLRVHEKVVSKNQPKRDYRFTEVLFIELTTHLSHTVEYMLLLFKYLLHQGLSMPQLFVVCDYPTDVFDFIEKEIMKLPVTRWRYVDKTVGDKQGLMKSWFDTSPTLEDKGIVTEIERGVRPDLYKFLHKQTLKDRFEDTSTKTVCVVVSSNKYFEKNLSDELADYRLYGDLDSFIATPPEDGVTPVLLLRTAEELLSAMVSRLIRPTDFVFDTRFKTGVNKLYAGNVPVPVRPNQDYVKSVIWKFQRHYGDTRESRIFVHDEGMDPVVRSVFLRSPIIDYMQMRMFDVDMLLLYTNYYEGMAMKNFLSIVRAEASVLRTLRFGEREFDKGHERNGGVSPSAKCVQLNIHPMVISLIENWCTRQVVYISDDGRSRAQGGAKLLPRIPILIFAAVMLTTETKNIEIKEHGTREHENDISQTSFYGRSLLKYLRLMEGGSVVMEEGGKTSVMLKRLLDMYKLTEKEMVLFDHNDFNHHLMKMMLEDYKPFILTQHNQSNYHGTYNTQMNWHVPQTTNLPQQLFPFTVTMGASRKTISLYVPLSPS
jgi:hypothetical protein